MNILKFNTGRTYTAAGQRIAAAVVDGRIAFLDLDRGIDGILAEGVEFTCTAILRAYDEYMLIEGVRIWDAAGKVDWDASYTLRQQLVDAAKTVTSSAR
jgi:hypothetical protein